MNQDGGRAIRGSAVMGFSLDPQKCLDEAAGDLRNMECAIYFNQCQEVNMVARLILLGAPNRIEEEVIRRTINKELQQIEKPFNLRQQCRVQIPSALHFQMAIICGGQGVSSGYAMGRGGGEKKSNALITHTWRLFSMFTNQTMLALQHCSRFPKN